MLDLMNINGIHKVKWHCLTASQQVARPTSNVVRRKNTTVQIRVAIKIYSFNSLDSFKRAKQASKQAKKYKQASKQTSKQKNTSKQTSNKQQANKQASKQANKQTSKQAKKIQASKQAKKYKQASKQNNFRFTTFFFLNKTKQASNKNTIKHEVSYKQS